MPTKRYRCTVSLPNELRDYVIPQAKSHQRPVSNQIAWMVKEYRRLVEVNKAADLLAKAAEGHINFDCPDKNVRQALENYYKLTGG